MEETAASGTTSLLLHPGSSLAPLNDNTLHELSQQLGIEYEILSILFDSGTFNGDNLLDDFNFEDMELSEDDEPLDLVTLDELNSLETVLFDNSSTDGQMSCVVCLEDFQKDETIKKLPCNHIFHISCIDHWLKINGTCPLCRSDINLWLMDN